MQHLLRLLLAIALSAIIPARATGQAANIGSDLAGAWKGELGEGADKLHILLTISKTADGGFAGQGQSVEQGATFPLEKVSMKGDTVHFEVAAVGGVYDGTLNAARTELKGMWTQSDVPAQPLNFVRPSEDAAKDAAAKMPEGPKRNRSPYLRT